MLDIKDIIKGKEHIDFLENNCTKIKVSKNIFTKSTILHMDIRNINTEKPISTKITISKPKGDTCSLSLKSNESFVTSIKYSELESEIVYMVDKIVRDYMNFV